MTNHDRYKEFEQAMTAVLLGNTVLFIAYLIVASAGIVWLKFVLVGAAMLLSGASLLALHLKQELTKPRSLWLSCGFFALLCCTLASLILGYPC